MLAYSGGVASDDFCLARLGALNIPSRRDGLRIGRRFSAGYGRFQIGTVPEGRGEPSGVKMIRITSFAEKRNQLRGFSCSTEACAASPRPSGTRDPFLFLSTGAEAPAYSRSASPRRGRFLLIRYPPRVPCTSRVRVKSAKHIQATPPVVAEPQTESPPSDVVKQSQRGRPPPFTFAATPGEAFAVRSSVRGRGTHSETGLRCCDLFGHSNS